MDSGKHSNPEPLADEDDRPEKFRDENAIVGRSYDCTFCKRGFTNAQALGGHMNIHRKDKAKAKQNSKETTSLTSNFKEVYINPRYFSTTSSEVPHYDHHHEAIKAKRNNYQVYIPPSNPSYQHGYYPYKLQAPLGEQPSMPEDHEDLSLGLNFFPHVEYGERRKENHVEYGERRKENEDDNEVDLELRLGHHR